jgi:hypothetical protein
MRSNGTAIAICVVFDAGKAKVRSRRGHSWSDKFKSSAASEAPMIARKPRRSHIYLLMYRRYQETIARPAPFEYHCAMPRSPSVGPALTVNPPRPPSRNREGPTTFRGAKCFWPLP